jgi:hypothetical protein
MPTQKQPRLDKRSAGTPGKKPPAPDLNLLTFRPILLDMAKHLPVMLETWEAAEEFRQRAVAKLQAIDIAMVAEGIVSKRIDGTYRSGPCPVWIKVRNPASDAVQRERSEKWNRMRDRTLAPARDWGSCAGTNINRSPCR